RGHGEHLPPPPRAARRPDRCGPRGLARGAAPGAVLHAHHRRDVRARVLPRRDRGPHIRAVRVHGAGDHPDRIRAQPHRHAGPRRLPAPRSRRGRRAPRRGYERALAAVIRHPARVSAGVLLIVAATAGLAARVGFDFLPPLDEGTLMVKVQSPPGTSLDVTDLQARRAAAIIARAPDVRLVVVRSGEPEGSEEPEGVNNTEIWVRLAPFARRTAAAEEIRRWIRDSLAAITGARVIVTAPLVERIEESLGQASAPLAV